MSISTSSQEDTGFTGADLGNLLNEAALLAARANKKVINMAELEEASEKSASVRNAAAMSSAIRKSV